jgi:hypothetical protein
LADSCSLIVKSAGRKRLRARIEAWLERRFFLRVHMALILGGTFLAGLAATKLLMLAQVNVLPLRYGLAVMASWLVFLLLIRLWLDYVRRETSIDIDSDFVELGFDFSGEVHDAIGGGGNFGGGGASGSWTDDAMLQPLKSSGGSSVDTPSGCGFDLDFDALAVILLVIALAAAMLFAGIYLIWSAPAILGEAAFEAALAAALAKRTKRISGAGWIGAVWRATFWPFVAILILSVAVGWAVQNACPEAQRLRDAFHCAEK